MTLFEMIIFIADKISAERNYPGVESYRALAQQDLTKAFQALLTMQFDRAVMQTGLAHLGRKLKLTYQE